MTLKVKPEFVQIHVRIIAQLPIGDTVADADKWVKKQITGENLWPQLAVRDITIATREYLND